MSEEITIMSDSRNRNLTRWNVGLARTDSSLGIGKRQWAVWIASIEILNPELKFLMVIISYMHKDLGRSPGSEWSINCAYREYIVLVRKVYIVDYFDVISRVQMEIYPLLQQIHPLLLLTKLPRFHIGSNPGRWLTLASTSSSLHRLMSDYNGLYMALCNSNVRQKNKWVRQTSFFTRHNVQSIKFLMLLPAPLNTSVKEMNAVSSLGSNWE